MSASGPDSSLGRLVREPTVHFLLVALLVFGVYALANSSSDQVLEIDPAEVEARVFMQEMATGMALSEAQRQALADRYIDEQILVQEALKLNLDNDARIHDLLAQKMRHVLSADVIQPTQEQLRQYYQTHQERYRRPATVTADELVFNTHETLPATVMSALERGADPDELLALQDGTSGPLRNASRLDLDNIFSAEFSSQVFAAESGQWQGPFRSNRGQHWLRVNERREAQIPPLAEMIDRIRLDWIATEEEALLQTQVERLREQYTIQFATGETH